jgi:hypothetical protein
MRLIMKLSVVIFLVFICAGHSFSEDDKEALMQKQLVDQINIELAMLKKVGSTPLDNGVCIEYISSYPNKGKGSRDYWIGAPYQGRYQEFSDQFEYDIQKTNSIISPYKGIVTYYYKWFIMYGDNKEECERTKEPTGMNSFFLTYTYAYQNNSWILKQKIDSRE